jgi:hypothetical protein
MEQTEQPLPPPYEGMSKAEVGRQRWKAKLKYKQQKELLGKVSVLLCSNQIVLRCDSSMHNGCATVSADHAHSRKCSCQ